MRMLGSEICNSSDFVDINIHLVDVNLHFGQQIIRVLRVSVGSISGEWQHSRQAAGLQPRGDTRSLQQSAAALWRQTYLSFPATLQPLHRPTERNQTDNTHQAHTH